MLRRNLNSQFVASHQVGSSASAFFHSKHASQAEQILPNLPPLKECLGAIYQAVCYQVEVLEKNTKAIAAKINKKNKEFEVQQQSALAKLESNIHRLEIEREEADKIIKHGNERVEFRSPCGYEIGYNSCSGCGSGHKETYIRKDADVELGNAVTKAVRDKRIINDKLVGYYRDIEQKKSELVASRDEHINELKNENNLLNRKLHVINNYKETISKLLQLINKYNHGSVNISKHPMGNRFPEICKKIMMPTELGQSMPTLLRVYFRGNDEALIKIAKLFLSMDEKNSISNWINDREQQAREQVQASEFCLPVIPLPSGVEVSAPPLTPTSSPRTSVILSDPIASAPPLTPHSSPPAASFLQSSSVFPHLMGLFHSTSNVQPVDVSMLVFPNVPQEEPQQEIIFPEVPNEELKQEDDREKRQALSS